jgi:hypothetical protein
MGNSVYVHTNMSEPHNGPPEPLKGCRGTPSKRRIPGEREQIKTAYASGIGSREIARNMQLPAGTVLARAKRERWTQQIAAAKLIERPNLAREIAKPDAISAISPMQSAALTMRQRGQRHLERMAGLSEKVVSHVETLEAETILDRVDKVEKLDRIARRNYGLDLDQRPVSTVNFNVVADHLSVPVQINVSSPPESPS